MLNIVNMAVIVETATVVGVMDIRKLKISWKRLTIFLVQLNNFVN